MKKYKVTSKHPFYKEGVIFNPNADGTYVIGTTNEPILVYNEYNFEIQVERGIIEEIPEPEFTRSDMISFARAISFMLDSPSYEEQFDIWLRNNK